MKPDILQAFGKAVRERRIALKLSQEDLAEAAGVHRTYVGMIERGEKNITLRNIEKFSRALRLPIDQLLKLKPHG